MTEREKFEKWCRANNGVPAKLRGTDRYIVPVVQGSWMAWQACAESNQEEIKQAYTQGSNDCYAALVNSGVIK